MLACSRVTDARRKAGAPMTVTMQGSLPYHTATGAQPVRTASFREHKNLEKLAQILEL